MVARIIFGLALIIIFSGLEPNLFAKHLSIIQQDSTLQPNFKNASFNLMANRSSISIAMGLYRSRISGKESNYNLTNLNFNFNLDLPFSYVLKYYNRPKDEIFKINMSVFLHISRYGNHGVGIALRMKALVYHNFFIAYQLGLARFEAINKQANDGLTNRGMQFNHIFMLSKKIKQHFEPYLALMHTSNGRSLRGMGQGGFWGWTDNQDVIAIGMAYHF